MTTAREHEIESWKEQITEMGGPLPRLYADRDCRGYAQREWAFEEWVRTYGNFGCIRLTHGWRSAHRYGKSFEHCHAVIMHADLSCQHNHWDDEPPCFCVGGGASRGMCGYCDWEGEIRSNERAAVEDAHDHAWPGWRDLPIAPNWPDQTTGKSGARNVAKWWAVVTPLYPPNWVAQGGPILTLRRTGSTRHVDGRHPHGGWDLCGAVDETLPCGMSRGKQTCPSLAGCLLGTCKPWADDYEED